MIFKRMFDFVDGERGSHKMIYTQRIIIQRTHVDPVRTLSLRQRHVFERKMNIHIYLIYLFEEKIFRCRQAISL